MTTRKIYKKTSLVTSIDELVSNKHKPFIIVHTNKSIPIEYNKLKVMAFSSIVSLMEDKKIYYAIIVEEEIIRKTKPKVIPKAKSEITGCKANLEDIYNEQS